MEGESNYRGRGRGKIKGRLVINKHTNHDNSICNDKMKENFNQKCKIIT